MNTPNTASTAGILNKVSGTATAGGRPWIGIYLILVALAHCLVTFQLFRGELAPLWYVQLIPALTPETPGGLPLRPGKTGVVWFFLFGLLLAIYAWAIHQQEKLLQQVGGPQSPLASQIRGNLVLHGGCIFLLCLLGVLLMPRSGFWLAIPAIIGLWAQTPLRKEKT